MFGIGWDVLHPKGNIIAPIIFIPAKKKTPKMRVSFAIQPSKMSMLKAICGLTDFWKTLDYTLFEYKYKNTFCNILIFSLIVQ